MDEIRSFEQKARSIIRVIENETELASQYDTPFKSAMGYVHAIEAKWAIKLANE